MNLTSTTKRFGHHQNAFGALRLLFASMVILAHTPALIDGNASRDILTAIFGAANSGSVAVDGFFIISGYLISASFLNSSSAWSYLKRRIARIYPAFIVVFVLCAFVVAPLGGGPVPSTISNFGKLLHDCLLLQQPRVEGAFVGRPFDAVNGSLWTIAYEFRCYLMVIALGLLGVLRKPHLVLGLALAFAVLTIALPPVPHLVWEPGTTMPSSTLEGYSLVDLRRALIGNLRENIRLVAAFLAGTSFYVFRGQLIFSRPLIVGAAIGLVLSFYSPIFVHVGMSLFGGYLIFAVAQLGGEGILGRINNDNDVSYGIYLYAWPITRLLDWWFPSASLIVMIAATWVLACICGWASWWLVEKPIMEAVRSKSPRASTPVSQLEA